jgi:hypothetical protein
MKLSVFLLLFSLCLPSSFRRGKKISPDENRFAVTIRGKKGFINTSGEVVIQPQFQDTQEFSEGLCAVRIEGRYGFVNTKGELSIPAIYDYATIFKEGLALVYLDGRPLFIKPDGKIAFRSNYKYMTLFSDGRAYVKTYSRKTGILNRQGVLAIDTIYSDIGVFQDGFAIVLGTEHREYDSEEKKKNLQVSVIDTTGRMLFPYGKFESIESYSEGYFEVNFPERKDGNISVGAIINTQGEVVFSLPKNQKSWIDGNVHNGILRVSLPLKKKSHDYYDAYMTLQGKVIYSDKATYTGTDFNENVAFVGNENFRYSMINRRGEIISKEKFGIPCCSSKNPFENGMAVVKFHDGTWGVIDTTARVVLKTSYTEVYGENLIENQYLFFQGERRDSVGVRYGLINLQGNVVIPPILEDFDPRGFVNGLLKATVDNKMTYFNREGETVWQHIIDEPGGLAPMNIDYMNRGYFYANYDYTGHPGEWRHAEPKDVNDEKKFTKESLTIVAYPDEDIAFFQKAKGMRVEVANTTADTVRFNAQDNRLYMKMQAKDHDGNWRDIEYLPSSWCGNSYHTVELPPRQYWSFVAPVYEGAIATTMRIALTYVDPSERRDAAETSRRAYRHARELIVYSNEFKGNINPAQFWRRPGYMPSGIMDPYNE